MYQVDDERLVRQWKSIDRRYTKELARPTQFLFHVQVYLDLHPTSSGMFRPKSDCKVSLLLLSAFQREKQTGTNGRLEQYDREVRLSQRY